MKIISANLNGIRSAESKGFFTWLQETHADVICMQEIKAQENDLKAEIKNLPHYNGFFHYADKKGYSGVGIYCRESPVKVTQGLGNSYFDKEGRFIRVDFANFSVISLYVPSGSSSPERQEVKFQFLDIFFPVMEKLMQENHPMILCGDWNIAHKEMDLKNWKGNLKNSGFLPEERAWLDKLYATGWVDVYRKLYPQVGDEGYTWWSNRGQAYAKNVGWRIDLQVASPSMAERAVQGSVYKTQKFSDHAPLIIDYR